MPDGVSTGWLSSVGRCVGGGQSREGGEAGCKSELHLERSADSDVALSLINGDGRSGEKADIMNKRATDCERATIVGFEDCKRVTLLQEEAEGLNQKLKKGKQTERQPKTGKASGEQLDAIWGFSAQGESGALLTI